MARPKLWFALSAALLLCLAADSLAKESPTAGLRYPSLTPDETQVVFGYRGDIWIAAVDGSTPPLRLTLHEAQETVPRVSPDGKKIAFTSARNGNYDIFVVPVTGGVPERVTFHSNYEILCDWSPDGKSILFLSARDADLTGPDLYEVSLEGGTPRRITFDGAREGSYSKDGKKIVYTRGFNTLYWDNYEGSANYDLYVVERTGGTPRQLTDTDGNERYPFFSADGESIWFVAEEKGVANFYSMPLAGGEQKPLTTYSGADVHRPDLGWDWDTVVFERAGLLYKTDLTNPAEKPDPIRLEIESDVRSSGVETRTITTGGEHVDVSRNGNQLAFSLRGDIWVMPASGGEGRRLTSGPANDQWPRFSPDGRTIAYFSNARGNHDIFLLNLANGSTRQVTNHSANDHFHNWSPDGKQLVFSSERSGNRDIWLLDLESGQETQLTTHRSGDDDPTFSPDGTKIAFDSARDGSQSIYVMNADGTDVRRVTGGTGFLQVPSFSPDGRMLVYESYVPTTGASGGLFVILTAGGPSMEISRDGHTPRWSPAGDYIYFHASRGGKDGIFRISAPDSVDPGERVPFIGRIQVDLRQELAQLFDEAWNALKEGFYDPKMHGVDWNAMRAKYRPIAIDAENKNEFHNVVRQMLAELGASHLGISGGSPSERGVTPPTKQTGYLGMEFDQAPSEDGWKVIEIVRGGPADQAGIRVGDVVSRIGSAKLDAKVNLDKVLEGTVGKDLRVVYRPWSETGLGLERAVTVKPANVMAIFQLHQRQWLAANERRVKEAQKKIKGQIGYIHLSQMNGPNLQKFQQAVSRWNANDNVKGMVIDVRNNGGGNIHNQLMAILLARPLARVQVRGGPKMTQPSLYWDRPVVLLTNERSFSDAEVFPHMFKAAEVGKVIGEPTAGGVIGTRNITLSDGSSFRIPTTGYWTMEGERLEGMGVKPDILVEMTAEDRLKDRDPQLDKALEVLIEEIEQKSAPEAKPEPKEEPKAEPTPEKPEVPAPEASVEKPLLDAAVGEWVVYRVKNPEDGTDSKLRLTVEKIVDDTVHFGREWTEGAAVELAIPPNLPHSGSVVDALRNYGEVVSRSKIAGKLGEKEEVPLLIVDVKMPDETMLKATFSNEVPGFGLVKAEWQKLVLLEAIEWGAPAPEAAPEPNPEAAEAEENEEAEAPMHPLHDVEVGEWSRIQISQGNRRMAITRRVESVENGEAVISQTATVNGREMRGNSRTRPIQEHLTPPDNYELVGFGEETLTVAGRDLTCEVMTATGPNGHEFKYYYCPEVAVDGIVRVTRDGQTIVQVVEWGFSAS